MDKAFTLETHLKSGKAYQHVENDLKYNGTIIVEQGDNEIYLTKSDLTKLNNLYYSILTKINAQKWKAKKEKFKKNLPKYIEQKKNSFLKASKDKKKSLYFVYSPTSGEVLWKVKGTWEEVVNFAFNQKRFVQVNGTYIYVGQIKKIQEEPAWKVIELSKSTEKRS